MRKSIPWTRRQYEDAYRLYRRFAASEEIVWSEGTPTEIVRAADYSYQARHEEFSGWCDRFSAEQFYSMSIERYPLLWFPF